MDIMEQLNAFWPIILMVVIFYFLLWRPQKKQQKKRQEMLESLKPGAKIVTVGGVMGNIVSLHDDYLVVRIADRVEIKVTRAAVAQVLGKAEGKKAAKKAEVKGGIHGRLEKAKAEIKAKESDKVPKNKSKELATAL